VKIIGFVDVFRKGQANIQPDVLQLDFWFGRHFFVIKRFLLRFTGGGD
jgi:hypothetical protein